MLTWARGRYSHVRTLELGFVPDWGDYLVTSFPNLAELVVHKRDLTSFTSAAHALWPNVRLRSLDAETAAILRRTYRELHHELVEEEGPSHY